MFFFNQLTRFGIDLFYSIRVSAKNSFLFYYFTLYFCVGCKGNSKPAYQRQITFTGCLKPFLLIGHKNVGHILLDKADDNILVRFTYSLVY